MLLWTCFGAAIFHSASPSGDVLIAEPEPSVDFMDLEFHTKNESLNGQVCHPNVQHDGQILQLPWLSTHEGFQVVTLESGNPMSHLYISYAYENLALADNVLTLADSIPFQKAQKIHFDGSSQLHFRFMCVRDAEAALVLLRKDTIINLHKFHQKIETVPHQSGLLFRVRKSVRLNNITEATTVIVASIEAADYASAFRKGGFLSFQFHSISSDLALATQLNTSDSSDGETQKDMTPSSLAKASKGKGKEREFSRKNELYESGDDDDDKWEKDAPHSYADKHTSYCDCRLLAVKANNTIIPSILQGEASATIVSYDDTVNVSWKCRKQSSKDEEISYGMLMLCYGIFNPFYYSNSKENAPSFPPSCSAASGIFPLSSESDESTMSFDFPAPHGSLPHGYYYFQLVKALASNPENYEENVIGVSNPLLYIHSPFHATVVSEAEPETEDTVIFPAVTPQTPLHYDPVKPGQKISVQWTYTAGSLGPALGATLQLCLGRGPSYAPEYEQYATPTPEGSFTAAAEYLTSFIPSMAKFTPDGPDAHDGQSYVEMPVPIEEGQGTIDFIVPDDIPSGSYTIGIRTERERLCDEKMVTPAGNSFLSGWSSYIFPQSRPPSAIDEGRADGVEYVDSDVDHVEKNHTIHKHVYAKTLQIFNRKISNQQIFISKPSVTLDAANSEVITVNWDIGVNSGNMPTQACLILFQDIPAPPIPYFNSSDDGPFPWQKRVALYSEIIDLKAANEFSLPLENLDINKWINSVSTLSRALSYPILGGDGSNSTHSFTTLLRHSPYMTQIREILRILPFPFYFEIRYMCDRLSPNSERVPPTNCKAVSQSQRFHIADPFGKSKLSLGGMTARGECTQSGHMLFGDDCTKNFASQGIRKVLSPVCALAQQGKFLLSTMGGTPEEGHSAETGPSVAVRYAPSYFYLDTRTARTQFHVELDMRLTVPLTVYSDIAISFENIWDHPQEGHHDDAPEPNNQRIQNVVSIEEKALLGPLNVELFGILFSLEAKFTPAGTIAVTLPESRTALNITPDMSFGLVTDYRNFISNEEIAAYENAPEKEKPENPPQSGLSYQFNFDIHAGAHSPQRVNFHSSEEPSDGRASFHSNVQLFSGAANITAVFSPDFAINTSLYSIRAQPSVKAELMVAGSYPPFPPYEDEGKESSVLIENLSACSHCYDWHTLEYRLSYDLLPFTLFSSHRLSPLAVSSTALSYAVEHCSIGRFVRRRWSIFRGQQDQQSDAIDNAMEIEAENGEEAIDYFRPNVPMRNANNAFTYEYFCRPENGDGSVTVFAGCLPYESAHQIFQFEIKGLLEELLEVVPNPMQSNVRNKPDQLEKATHSRKLDWQKAVKFRRKLASFQLTVGDVNQILSSVFSSVAECQVEVKMLWHNGLVTEEFGENGRMEPRSVDIESSKFSADTPIFLSKAKVHSLREPTHLRLAVFTWDNAAEPKIADWLEGRVHSIIRPVRCSGCMHPSLAYYTPSTMGELERFTLPREEITVDSGKSIFSFPALNEKLECADFIDLLSPVTSLLENILGNQRIPNESTWIIPAQDELSEEEKFYLESVFLHPKLQMADILQLREGMQRGGDHQSEGFIQFPHRVPSRDRVDSYVDAESREGEGSQDQNLYSFFEHCRELFDMRNILLIVAFSILVPILYWLWIFQVPIFLV